MAYPISRFPVPSLDSLPDDVRARILKVQEKYNDPVELAEHEAEELAELLIRLVENARK